MVVSVVILDTEDDFRFDVDDTIAVVFICASVVFFMIVEVA